MNIVQEPAISSAASATLAGVLYDPNVAKIFIDADVTTKLLPLLDSPDMGLVVRGCACLAAISETTEGVEALKKSKVERKLEVMSKSTKDPQLLQFVSAALGNLKK